MPIYKKIDQPIYSEEVKLKGKNTSKQIALALKKLKNDLWQNHHHDLSLLKQYIYFLGEAEAVLKAQKLLKYLLKNLEAKYHSKMYALYGRLLLKNCDSKKAVQILQKYRNGRQSEEIKCEYFLKTSLRVHYEQKMFKQAATDFLKILKLSQSEEEGEPYVSERDYQLGINSLMLTGQSEEAYNSLFKAVKDFPSNGQFNYLLWIRKLQKNLLNECDENRKVCFTFQPFQPIYRIHYVAIRILQNFNDKQLLDHLKISLDPITAVQETDKPQISIFINQDEKKYIQKHGQLIKKCIQSQISLPQIPVFRKYVQSILLYLFQPIQTRHRNLLADYYQILTKLLMI